MPTNLLPGLVAVLHELAAVVLIGAMFAVLVVLMPAVDRLRSPRDRLLLRRRLFRRMFAWAWLGLLMMWLTGFAELILVDEVGPHAHLVLMALLSLVLTLTLVLAQFGLLFQVTIAMEDRNSERARWLLNRLRQVLIGAFVLALTITVLDVAGAILIPEDFFQLLGWPG
jgi:uncharacterized membrane protein